MLAVALAVLAFAVQAAAYIPAMPTNNTNAVNQSDMSMLTMKWSPAGTYSNTVSYQLASLGSNGFDQGALVHFSEQNLTDMNTTSPWIALVDCDKNTSDASQVDDIFTLARDRGAVAALLYSTTAEACQINPAYASPDNFEQILDIFATQSRSSAQIITSQFSNLHNASFGNFNATQLNDSASSIVESMRTSNITSPFIVATLRAANSTVNINGTTDDNGSSGADTSSGQHGNPNTGLAMIILYAITGCVSGLFIIVILSGAVRAIRHPERYGPRAGGGGQGAGTNGQSRTGGIGRAILDTFPIIKFGQSNPEVEGPEGTELKSNDIENQAANVMGAVRDDQDEKNAAEGSEPAVITPKHEGADAEPSSATGASTAPSPDAAGAPTAEAEVQPSAIGHETCPICIVDFEPGDDLRVLPCEGKHKFHQACVDPWLLELSTSCPLCREDFHALESMMAGDEMGSERSTTPPAEIPNPTAAPSSRFSKYLRFARRRNQSISGEEALPSSSRTPLEEVEDV
ncbi:hypothetical protein K439DRAFT_1632199 [Ramaria rubella]|nr:hypothetical protein K439DRAFT_1632199 [Ramaria rubella]